MIRYPILAALLLAASVAFGQTDAETAATDETAERIARVEALAAQGNDAYAAGDFDTAITRYLEAFELDTRGVTILYNVAVIYDYNLDDPVLARTYYRRFLSSPLAEPGLMTKATTRLRAVEERIRAAETAAEPAPAPVTTAPPPAAPPPTTAAPGVQVTSSDPGSPVGPLVTLGLGGAVIVAGGVLTAMVHGDHTTFEAEDDPDTLRTLRADGQSLARTADITMAVGATTVVVGLIWWLIADDPAPAARPAMAPGGSPAVEIRW